MSEYIKEGSIVSLKSGGPSMTVTKRYDNNTVSCQWFPTNADLKEATFNIDTLEISSTKRIDIS